MQQELTNIQTVILTEKLTSDEIAQHSFESIPKIKGEIKAADERLGMLLRTLQADMETVAEIRGNVIKQLRNAELARRYVERLSANLPLMTQQNLPLPPPFFRELATSFEKRMEQYRHVINELSQLKLDVQQKKAYTPQMLQEIIRNQYEALMVAAARVADLHGATQRAKEQYVMFLNQSTGGTETVDDIFEREEKKRERQKARLMPVAAPPTPTVAPAAALSPAQTPIPTSSLWSAGTGPSWSCLAQRQASLRSTLSS